MHAKSFFNEYLWDFQSFYKLKEIKNGKSKENIDEISIEHIEIIFKTSWADKLFKIKEIINELI